jgi:hypothetical protein
MVIDNASLITKTTREPAVTVARITLQNHILIGALRTFSPGHPNREVIYAQVDKSTKRKYRVED